MKLMIGLGSALFTFLIIFFFFFYPFNSSNEILIIDSNIESYRIIPEDKGGINTPDLNIYKLGD